MTVDPKLLAEISGEAYDILLDGGRTTGVAYNAQTGEHCLTGAGYVAVYRRFGITNPWAGNIDIEVRQEANALHVVWSDSLTELLNLQRWCNPTGPQDDGGGPLAMWNDRMASDDDVFDLLARHEKALNEEAGR